MTSPEPGRRTALILLAIATAIGALFRFYRLDWGAPYFHFHMDEHYVFMGADLLRRDPERAAMSSKFFMYSPGPMYAVNYIRSAWEWWAGAALNLETQRDQITYMVLGRAFSATLGTLTIPAVYAVASRVAGRLAGVIAAFLIAFSVLHLRESHFFTVDVSLTFFSVLAWFFLVRTVQRGRWSSGVGAGIAFGLATVSKYTAVYLAPLIALSQLLSPDAPKTLRPLGAWVRPVLRTAAIGVLAVATFLILDPLVVQYWDKFRSDIREQVTTPLTGISQPIFFAHFTNIGSPRLYWITNLLWWGLGPAFEIAALIGMAWLLFVRRDRVSLMLAAIPLVFWLVAGQSVAPFMRYAVPLAPAMAVIVGVAGVEWLRQPRLQRAAAVALSIVLLTTAFWAGAYMNIYRSEDTRLAASRWIAHNVPDRAKILVEPTHNTPPMASYRTKVNFYGDHVIWASFNHPRGEAERDDYYRFYALDVYRYLYNPNRTDEERREYIARRLSMVDWIVTDDTYMRWYGELPDEEYGVVKQHYRDLLDGKLGFELVQSFQVRPSLFGIAINDDNAEFTFRYFDHPPVYIFRRVQPSPAS
ncbi:MAG: ArnT family glycosyltransferase [Vicinamibacterales bacterium]